MSLIGLTGTARTQACAQELSTVQSAMDAYMAANNVSSVTAPAALAPRSGGMESDEERAAPDRTDAIVGGWQAYEEAELPRLRGLSMSRPWRLAGPALRNATLDLGSRSKWVFFTCVLGDTLAFKRASPYSWLCLTPEQTDADAFAADVVKAVIDSRLSGPP